MTSPDSKTRAARHQQGPPWIGPVVPLHRYERLWLGVYILMGVSATIFFGWRAAFMVCLTTTLSLVVYLLVALAMHMIRGRAPGGSISQALNMGLLMGLVMPLMPQMAVAVIAGSLVGALVHLMGPTHRMRVHPVAAAYLVLMLGLPLIGQQQVQSVLAPSRVVFGDAWRFTGPVGGPNWISMTVPEQYDAIRRPNPQQIMHQQQQDILRHASRMVVLLRSGDLPRIEDVILGSVPGPVGATSQMLLIIVGLWLMYRRVGRWPVALTTLAAALAMLLLLPVKQDGAWVMSWQCFDDIGWKAAAVYFGYQLLASPLLLIALIMMPMTAPRTARGRMIYAVLIGAGIVGLRWIIPLEAIAYAPLVAGGLLCPLLDRMHKSPFVQQSM